MLRIKYYKNFKGNEDFLLVLGDSADYKRASARFEGLDGCFLPSSGFLALEDMGDINPNKLVFTKTECSSFAKVCENLATEGQKGHHYFSIKSLPDIDFLISCGEYDSLP